MRERLQIAADGPDPMAVLFEHALGILNRMLLLFLP